MTTTTATAPSIPSTESSTTTTPSPAEQNVPEVVSQSPASEPTSKPRLFMKENEPEKKDISRRPDPTTASTTTTTESTTAYSMSVKETVHKGLGMLDGLYLLVK